MKKMRYGLILFWLLACPVTSAVAQVSIGIGLPNLSIGINLPLFPQLVAVPGYPVYYAPQVNANYFFYDGMYWVFQNDNWYASSWYNGPWAYVAPEVVPVYVLRIPVRYYRQPPVYFRDWRPNAPPRWGQHWGHRWEKQRSGWDRWDRRAAPARAPLPAYQRQYSGERYPRVEQQHTLRSQSYRYQPSDRVVRQHYRQQTGQSAAEPARQHRQDTPPMRTQRPPDLQGSPPLQQGVPHDQRSQQPQQRGPSTQGQRQPSRDTQYGQPVPRSQSQEQVHQDRRESHDSDRGHGHGGEGQGRDEERGRGRNN